MIWKELQKQCAQCIHMHGVDLLRVIAELSLLVLFYVLEVYADDIDFSSLLASVHKHSMNLHLLANSNTHTQHPFVRQYGNKYTHTHKRETGVTFEYSHGILNCCHKHKNNILFAYIATCSLLSIKKCAWRMKIFHFQGISTVRFAFKLQAEWICWESVRVSSSSSSSSSFSLYINSKSLKTHEYF